MHSAVAHQIADGARYVVVRTLFQRVAGELTRCDLAQDNDRIQPELVAFRMVTPRQKTDCHHVQSAIAVEVRGHRTHRPGHHRQRVMDERKRAAILEPLDSVIWVKKVTIQ